MTRVTYDICLNGRKVKEVSGYEEANQIVAELGRGWSYKVRYTDFDPDDTPEKREKAREHARKVREAIKRKAYEKEFAHAPAYVNISGVGAT